jgi:hypothetical protein
MKIELVEQPDNRRMLHVTCTADDLDGWLWAGKYNKTFITVYQAVRPDMVTDIEKIAATMAEDMQNIVMDKGFKVTLVTKKCDTVIFSAFYSFRTWGSPF